MLGYDLPQPWWELVEQKYTTPGEWMCGSCDRGKPRHITCLPAPGSHERIRHPLRRSFYYYYIIVCPSWEQAFKVQSLGFVN
jgi:hypothetical protein